MTKDLAIAVIHGNGTQGGKRPADSSKSTFSQALRKRVKRELGDALFERVSWREIFWADILQTNQRRYLKAIKRITRQDALRDYVLCNLSDAASYRISPTDPNDDTYERVHQRVAETMAELDADVAGGKPLLVLAHSLGGHIMSNYIYDISKPGASSASGFQRFKTMAGFITFGCNIPLFLFGYKPEDIVPITFPGTDLPTNQRSSPWWRNYYDKDDVLGYPLKQTGPNYEALVAAGELKDISIDAGNLFTAWNPGSHNAYWRDADFYEPVANEMRKLLTSASA